MAHFLHEPDAVFKSLTVAAKTRNQKLFQIVDFSNSLFEMDNRFFMQIPGKSVSWTTFSDVFEIYFWVVLFFAAVILTLAIYAIYQGPIPLIFFLSGGVWSGEAADQEMLAPILLPHPPKASCATGNVGLNLALGLVTSCCGCQTA